MIGSRTRYSLAQFLALHEIGVVVVLLGKHNMNDAVGYGTLITDIVESLSTATDESLLSLLEEIARTSGDFEARTNPRYRHKERFADLRCCLLLDGYIIDNGKVVQSDPSISDAPPVEDELVAALRASGLSVAEDVIRKIGQSSESFRSLPPNYNACLNDIRVALETLARAIAMSRRSGNALSYDPSKWGGIISFLRQIGFISEAEERGLAGVYSFVSPGSHRSIGISEEQMARLGRSFALGMCWFLVKSHTSAP